MPCGVEMPQHECPNDSGACASLGCGATSAVLWYGKVPNKICKKCYDKTTKTSKKRQHVDEGEPLLSPAHAPAMALSSSYSSDAYISQVYAIRSHRYRSPPPTSALCI